jgi:hypothetical protein
VASSRAALPAASTSTATKTTAISNPWALRRVAIPAS